MAIQIIREVSADVVKRGSTRTIYAKQNDFNSRFLNVRIQADGKDIIVKSTSTVILNVERSDDATGMFYGAVNTDGTVTVPLTSWMLALEGTLVCDISIVSVNPSEAKLTTMKFNIVVEAAVISDESFIDTEDYSVIVDLLDRAEEAIKASDAANRAEAAANIAVTEASKAAASVTQAQEIVDSVSTTLNNHDSRITRNTKEIINLKAGVPDEDFVEDASVTYRKDVPTGALPNAMISEIGGMTRKCENLFSGEISAKTAPTTYSFVNGTLKLKRNGGGIQGGVWSKEKYKSGTYTISFSLMGMESTNFVLATTATASASSTGSWIKTWYSNGNVSYTFTLAEDRHIGFFTDGSGVEITAANVMLNKSETALPYEPYFEGLRDAKVTAVESVGANLFGVYGSNTLSNGSVTANGDEAILTLKNTAESYGEDYNLSSITLDAGAYYFNSSWSADKDLEGVYVTSSIYNADTKERICGYNAAFMLNKQTKVTWGAYTYAPNIASKNNSITITFKYWITKGETKTDYKPYKKNTFEIPEAVQALDEYGEGIPGGKYNLLSLEDKKYYKNVKRSILKGTESVSYANHSAGLNTQQFNVAIADCGSGLMLCDRLPSSWDAPGGGLGAASVPTQLVLGVPKSWLTPFGFVDGTASTYVSSFVAYLKNEYSNGTPVTVVYALATPIETDISDYFGEDNLIGVEAGGTITAVNEYEYDVPTTITYQIKSEVSI